MRPKDGKNKILFVLQEIVHEVQTSSANETEPDLGQNLRDLWAEIHQTKNAI